MVLNNFLFLPPPLWGRVGVGVETFYLAQGNLTLWRAGLRKRPEKLGYTQHGAI
jgi:hypothetical protein